MPQRDCAFSPNLAQKARSYTLVVQISFCFQTQGKSPLDPFGSRYQRGPEAYSLSGAGRRCTSQLGRRSNARDGDHQSSNGTSAADATGTDIGNVGRNALRGPRQTNVDISVIRRFRIDESKNVEFRAEFFNLFNQVNFANPISNLNAVQSSGGP